MSAYLGLSGILRRWGWDSMYASNPFISISRHYLFIFDINVLFHTVHPHLRRPTSHAYHLSNNMPFYAHSAVAHQNSYLLLLFHYLFTGATFKIFLTFFFLFCFIISLIRDTPHPSVFASPLHAVSFHPMMSWSNRPVQGKIGSQYKY